MIWITGTALTAVLTIALGAPMMARRGAIREKAGPAHDIEIYRGQLRGIEADVARGQLDAEEAGRLRAEIGRRLLQADRDLQKQKPETSGEAAPKAGMMVVGGAVLALSMAGALYAYHEIGAPSLPDSPLSQRLAEAQRQYETRPSQAEAEAANTAGPQMPAMPADPEFDKLMIQLREKVAETPEPRGLQLLADYETRLGNLPSARSALEKLIAMQSAQEAVDTRIHLAALMIEAAGGVITREAEQHIAAALTADPDHQQARYMHGLLFAQNGRPDRTFSVWSQLLEDSSPDAPWYGPIRQIMGDLAWAAGNPDYVLPEPAALPSPSAEDVAAMAELSEADRAAAIDAMVANLEARLATEGGSPAEWARLVTALSVKGESGRAQVILSEAREVFSGSPDAQTLLSTAAQQAGLE